MTTPFSLQIMTNLLMVELGGILLCIEGLEKAMEDEDVSVVTTFRGME